MLTLVSEDLMLTIEDVAERFKVSVMTVRRMVERGELNAYRIGGQIRFKEEEIDAFVESQRVEPKHPKNAHRPVRLTEGEMAKVGVDLLPGADTGHIWLRCQNCGSTWSPNIQPGGRLPRNYWRCPNGCNSDERLEDREERETR